MSNENQNKKAAEKAKEVEEKLKDKKVRFKVADKMILNRQLFLLFPSHMDLVSSLWVL